MESLKVLREEWSAVTGAVLLDMPEYLDKKNKHDYAYRKIKEWIIRGELPADTILVERQLCEMLGLSRTPVRSALQELAKDGFVLTAPGRGMMVSRVQIEDVIEIFEIRRSLDILALELFMKSGREDLIKQMRRTVEDMKKAMDQNDCQAFVQADQLFHELYSHNTGNQRLEKICMDLSEQEHRILSLTINDTGRCKMSYRHHLAIMAKIEEGDVRKATALLRKHLTDSMEYHVRKMSRI